MSGTISGTVKVPLQLYSLPGRYATALYTAAVKNNSLATVETELPKIRATIFRSKLFGAFLSDPTIAKPLKQKSVEEFLKASEHSDLVVRFFGVLAENGRLGDTMQVIAAFEELLRAHHGEVPLTIISARPLDSATVDRITNIITQRFLGKSMRAKLEMKVDSKILGGLVIELGDKSIDLSAASRVNQLNKSLYEATF